MKQNSPTHQTANGTPAQPPDPRLVHLHRRLFESFDELWDDFVDPADALYDLDGTRWSRLGGEGVRGATSVVPFNDESQLAEIRDQCRALALTNEFAINGHENRISYIVGTGHAYRVAGKKRDEVPESLIRDAQDVLDEFVRANHWQKRQQEIVRRKDRDGECFLRFFHSGDGTVRVRFVEPEQVATPVSRAGDPAAAFGIQTDPDDVETAIGYWIDGRPVDAAEIQHRKSGVDANVKRGLSLFYPVRKNLRRAEKLLRNMSVVAEIQSAIALIRKHVAATSVGVEQFVQNQADLSVTSQSTGRTSHFRRYGPGTILDAVAGTQYEFPAAGIDAARYVVVLQAELRAIASRLVMPEFMLTSDASNANYSSTMVAEGPAVKMFGRLQQEMIEEDEEVMWRALGGAVEAGRLPPETLTSLDVRGIPPTLAVRDRLKDAQADQILLRNGAMSVQTMAMRHGLDPDRERQLIGRDAVGQGLP
ncbi:MAG TPA: phage portal protein [Thermoguttaceae bacterium]|nr:phage portal protein [Thermoguttaceae bacterium]